MQAKNQRLIGAKDRPTRGDTTGQTSRESQACRQVSGMVQVTSAYQADGSNRLWRASIRAGRETGLLLKYHGARGPRSTYPLRLAARLIKVDASTATNNAAP